MSVTAVLFLPMTRTSVGYYIFLLSFLLSLILTRAFPEVSGRVQRGSDEGTPFH